MLWGKMGLREYQAQPIWNREILMSLQKLIRTRAFRRDSWANCGDESEFLCPILTGPDIIVFVCLHMGEQIIVSQ